MTKRLIPFDLEAAKAEPSRVRHNSGESPLEVLFGSDGSVHCRWASKVWTVFKSYADIRLTAPAPKSVEVRAALWDNGIIDFWKVNFKLAEDSQHFVRWLPNWHIEAGKVFVEVE